MAFYTIDHFLCVTLGFFGGGATGLLLNFSESLAIFHVVLAWFLMETFSVCS